MDGPWVSKSRYGLLWAGSTNIVYFTVLEAWTLSIMWYVRIDKRINKGNKNKKINRKQNGLFRGGRIGHRFQVRIMSHIQLKCCQPAIIYHIIERC